MKINDLTKTEINFECLNEKAIEWELDLCKAAYASCISWLYWYEGILEKNDLSKEEDRANMEDIDKQKVNVETNMVDLEKKIVFLNKIYDTLNSL